VPRRATLRASDADRESVADRLRHAAAEGRLSTEELEERLASALKARTYAELDSVLVDLPGKKLAPRRAPGRTLAAAHPVATAIVMAVAAAVVLATITFVLLVGAAWIAWIVFLWAVFGSRRRGSAYRARRRGYAYRAR
jgi:hypothetical protein